MSSGIYGKSSDMKANIQHMEKLEDILVDIMVSNSNQDKNFWITNTVKDFYITPTEALDLCVIDVIIPQKHKRGSYVYYNNVFIDYIDDFDLY
jgi:ATP-dependent protease ClpP protease subunit